MQPVVEYRVPNIQMNRNKKDYIFVCSESNIIATMAPLKKVVGT